MDCEKFDQIILDALYEELDELTLAAAKRHADGCPRCQAAWSGLKATRKVGILPLIEAPAGLDARILAHARDAQLRIPWPKRLGRGISWAGSYAMRPQTAMAAILLLMLGSSVIFVRVKPDRSGAPSRVSVTERGIPEQASEELQPDKLSNLEPKSVPAARGRREDERAASSAAGFAAPPAAPAAAAPAAALAARDVPSEGERAKALDKAEGALGEPPARSSSKGGALAQAGAGDDLARNSAADKREDLGPGLGGVSALDPAPAAPAATAAPDAYGAAMDLYSAGRYADAEKAFTEVASAGSKNAASASLYAGKSAEAAFGCGKAAPKYEATASRYGGSTPGAEALWGAANCYKAVGNLEKARQLYISLRSVAGYRDRAEGELENLRLAQSQPMAKSKATKAAPAKPVFAK